MLTKKQHELLLFIHGHLQRHGVSPSFDEMKDALALKSKSGIHRLITGLEERGFIKRLPHRARAVEVTRLPEDLGTAPQVASSQPALDQTGMDHAGPVIGNPKPGFAPRVIQGDFSGSLPGAQPANDSEALQLPLYGRIAAGTPIEALRDYSTHVDVPSAMIGTGEHYALEVDGDSMVDAGILDGDTVLIERCDSADNGAIVVALIDKEEATLKRLRRKGGAIALEPANQAYETRIFPPERVTIQGRLVGLLRRY
ncbi:transcriptional repressor LexA [Pelagibius sp.]|uniref:transcriptional repressor LexA n=1 Tax=Pelagibius sp. TaxID=1931238 RepID=UPI00261FB931|nr:transcriptional repressor LexA [Pelagibius sp.]